MKDKIVSQLQQQNAQLTADVKLYKARSVEHMQRITELEADCKRASYELYQMKEIALAAKVHNIRLKETVI